MTDWAAKVLADVPRHNAQDAKSMTGYAAAVWLHEDAVVDAIAKLGAEDGLVEEAREVLEGLSGRWPEQYTDEARDTITALLAHIAALTAQVERRGRIHKSLSKRFAEANSARKAAEAERDALRAKVARLEGAVMWGRDAMETCGNCMGSGYSGHPDSGAVCADCNGSGGVRAALTDGAADE